MLVYPILARLICSLYIIFQIYVNIQIIPLLNTHSFLNIYFQMIPHLALSLFLIINLSGGNASRKDNKIEELSETNGPNPCTCGIFLSGQIVKGSKQPPKGEPVLLQEMENHFMNNAVGNRQCINKCLELVSRYLFVFLI